jgi:hypothetical protein
MTEKAKKWSEQAVSTLLATVGSESPVSVATVEKAAEALGVTVRSVASKLRQLDHEVASMATVKAPAFTAEQGQALASFVNSNAGQLTYKEIAEQFQGGAFTAKQVQGKLLALELTTYTEAEEAKFVKMAKAGSFIEEIAEALGKTVPSVRGKALSLSRNGQIDKIPAQKESHAKNVVDAVAALGDKIKTMTVAEIATAVDKTERGLKTLLTRRGITVADYDGAAKKAKAEAKAAA